MYVHRLMSLLLVFTLLPVTTMASSSAEFRGYSYTNQRIRERLFLPGTNFELGYFIGQYYDPHLSNLLDLVGTYKVGFSGGVFRNGAPNALNMLIWHLMISKLAENTALICEGKTQTEHGENFNPDFIANVFPLCAWPYANSQQDNTLFAFWLTLMKYDAPITEFYAWRDFLLQNSEIAQMGGSEAVEWMTHSILDNPYFLLGP